MRILTGSDSSLFHHILSTHTLIFEEKNIFIAFSFIFASFSEQNYFIIII